MRYLFNVLIINYKRIKFFLRSIPLYGNSRYCPICNKSFSKFLSFGQIPRKDAKCPRCDSLERERSLWLYLKKNTDIFQGGMKKILHVAPELCLLPKLQKLYHKNYITADLVNPSSKVIMDITNINFPDNTFDIILCNHVLEHIIDDGKALKELFRVLKKGGWAILLVPISVETTYEDHSIITPEERFKAFGRTDHVRRYGADYIERVQKAGFKVKSLKVREYVSTEDISKLRLQPNEIIFHCFK